MMDLSSVVAAFQTGTYSVARMGTASYGTDGRSVPGTTSTVSVAGTSIPMGGRDLQNLPEGMRTKQLRWLYTSATLYGQDSGHEPDVVTIDGNQWQVQSVEPWAALGNFQRYLLMKVGN